MKRIFWGVLALAGSAVAEPPLTLDPAVMEEAKRAVFERGCATTAVAERVPQMQTIAEQWMAAMDAAGTELLPVRLLALLQSLNPGMPMQEHEELYAEALRLHVLAAAGNKQARAVLALAFETGRLPSGLCLMQNWQLAARMRN